MDRTSAVSTGRIELGARSRPAWNGANRTLWTIHGYSAGEFLNRPPRQARSSPSDDHNLDHNQNGSYRTHATLHGLVRQQKQRQRHLSNDLEHWDQRLLIHVGAPGHKTWFDTDPRGGVRRH